MLELYQEVAFNRQIADIRGIAPTSDGLYLVSNQVNRIIKVDENGKVLTSFYGLASTDYLHCTSATLDQTLNKIYMSLENGTVWTKDLTSGTEEQIIERYISGIALYNSKLFFVDQDSILGSYDLATKVITDHSRLTYTCSGLCYRSSDNKFLTVDQAAGHIVVLDFDASSENFTEITRHKGLKPFFKEWFDGDIIYYNDTVFCSLGNRLFKYRPAGYQISTKINDVFTAISYIDFGQVVMGSSVIKECKIENISLSTLNNVQIRSSGIYSVSLDGQSFSTEISVGDIPVAGSNLFWVKVVMPVEETEGVEYTGEINIEVS